MVQPGESHEVETRVEVVGYGRPATSALARRLAAAKATGHPLDPITVVVPSNAAGLSARRLLTTGAAGLAPCNLANVSFVTPYRLSELLGSSSLGGRKPLTTPVLSAAVRATLATNPGMFAAVAEHSVTQAAVTQAFSELSRARPSTRSCIRESSTRGAELVRVVDEIERRLTDFYDEDDLAEAATAAVVASGELAGLGALVWYLPQRLSPALSSLVAACLQRTLRPSVIIGLTGDAAADAAVVGAVRAAGVPLPDESLAGAQIERPAASRLVTVSDADEEVREVIRQIVQLVEAGTRLDRIAVFRPSDGSYGRTLANQLDGADIPWNGPGNRSLAESVAGRTLLRALALDGGGWGRAALIDLVSDAPVHLDAARAPARRWDEVSREAGVVGGRDDWCLKLDALSARLQKVVVDVGDDDDSARVERRRKAAQQSMDAAHALQGFLDALDGRLASVRNGNTWAARSEGARQVVLFLLGPEHGRTAWTEGERQAAQRVDEALARLSALDAIEAGASLESFRTALASELSAPSGRIGRFGDGVLVAPLSSAIGLDHGAVFVLGMAEGSCPSVRRDDALLPESDRLLAEEGELVTQDERLRTQHRNYLAAVASGTQQCTLLFPRGDLRGRRDRLPSRWLLDSASAQVGARVFSSELPALPPSVLATVPSYVAGVREAAVHGSIADRDVAALSAVRRPHRHPLATGDLGRGFTAQRSRTGAGFTEWDGNLSSQTVGSTAARSLSPSRLQEWAKCPFSYFLGNVLHLRERDDPERITELGAAEKGTLVHAVLETFVQEVLDRPQGAPEPDEPWTPADRRRVGEIATDEFADVERRGLTGRALTWRRTQLEVRRDLDIFFTKDDEHRRTKQVRPIRVEMPFGGTGEPPLTVELASGKVLLLKGKADRIDAGDDGRHIVVDYKTGSGKGYEGLDDDPVLEGQTLQLGVYAEAAMAQFGVEQHKVESIYWMISRKGGFKKYGYPWTDAHRNRFLEVTEAIVDGIEGGIFPARSGEYQSFWGSHENCGFCDFDRICSRDREDHQRAMAGADELSILDRLKQKVAEA